MHVVNLYMHEVAMHVNHNVDEFKPPFTEAALRGPPNATIALTPTQIGALSTCLASIDGIFETFLKFDVETVRCLPVAHFVRVAYAVVVLIKMYFAAATPGGELGKIIDHENMKVVQYLDGLVELFRASAADEKSRPAAKFLMVLIMLKTWFNRQKDGKGGEGMGSKIAAMLRKRAEVPKDMTSESSQNGHRFAGPQRSHSGYSPANTPLQMLSEVATGNSLNGDSRSGNVHNFAGVTNDWQTQQQQFQNFDPSMMNQLGGFANMDQMPGMDYATGEGFEQAMAFTLGGGDFRFNGMNDASFFGDIMGGMGGSGAFSF